MNRAVLFDRERSSLFGARLAQSEARKFSEAGSSRHGLGRKVGTRFYRGVQILTTVQRRSRIVGSSGVLTQKPLGGRALQRAMFFSQRTVIE